MKGAALVKLSALKLQSKPWPVLSNITAITEELDQIEITSDNWFENVLKIYKRNKIVPDEELDMENHTA